jgi:hypothetical protein
VATQGSTVHVHPTALGEPAKGDGEKSRTTPLGDGRARWNQGTWVGPRFAIDRSRVYMARTKPVGSKDTMPAARSNSSSRC